MNTLLIVSALSVAAAASCANGFTVDCRWQYDLSATGNNFQPMPLGGLNVDPLTPFVRLRLEFQVTDGMPSDAAGGFAGWNVGTLLPSGECCESLLRTPGRAAPFNFLSNGNGMPAADPVPCETMLTGIDATLGFQAPFWGCAADGTPLPMPAPTVRGLGSFVSVYNITLNLSGIGTATVTAAGNAIVATSWGFVGEPTEPNCGDPLDPLDDIPGSVIYAPATAPPVAFTCVATVNCIPAPASVGMVALGTFAFVRRRR